MKYYQLYLEYEGKPIIIMTRITEVSILKVLDKYLPLSPGWRLKVYELIEGDNNEIL